MTDPRPTPKGGQKAKGPLGTVRREDRDKPYREATILLQRLELSLKRGTYNSSNELATKTLTIVERYVQSTTWKSAEEVLIWLRIASERLGSAAPSESASCNMIQRLIKIIKEEFSAKKNVNVPAAYPSRLDSSEFGNLDFTEEIPDLRSDILNATLELSSELESSADNIAEDAEKHIHQRDVVLTVGKSRTVAKFFEKAKEKERQFEVIVVSGGPFDTGRDMVKDLRNKHNIPATLVDDTGVFSVMSRVSKVIIGTHTILANGGLKAVSGCHPVLLVAKYYNVPVIVLAPLYKLSPEYPLSSNAKITNRFVSPETLVEYEDLDVMENVNVYATVFDYVPPELITLFIFNIGSHSPSYIYRLLRDTYPQL